MTIRRRLVPSLLIAAAAMFPACSAARDQGRTATTAAVTLPAPAPPAAPAAQAHGVNWPKDPDADPTATTPVGARGWRDPTVYVDGVPVGVLRFPELPRALRPVWITGTELLDYAPGQKGPRSRAVRYRRFRLAEYLAAVGVDVSRVRAVHLYGGSGGVAVVSGADLRRTRDRLYFDFARDTEGNVRPFIPADLTLNTSFDQIAGVCVYVDKPAPEVTDDGTVLVDGQPTTDVPYFGAPQRGGIRVYLDDRLAVTIKRNRLPTDGGTRPLLAFLAEQGVDTSHVRRARMLYRKDAPRDYDATALASLGFDAGARAQGAIALSDGTAAGVIQLYRK